LNCEICGKKVNKLYDGIIAGIKLKVCSECSKLGTIINEPPKIQQKRIPIRQAKIIPKKTALIPSYKIVDNYSQIIKNAREKMGLSQDILASYLGEKLSVIKKIEGGKLKPSLELAKKMEKLLKVNLIEEESSEELEIK
jgi:putative transcription factor